MSSRLLAIESATDWLSIALFEGDELARLHESGGTRRHASELMPLIAAALDELAWPVETLDSLAVSAGPGSFTSLRIGLATAKGLAFGRDFQGASVSTLEAMALGAFEQGGAEGETVLALLDARRGEWYAGAYRQEGVGGRVNVLAEGLYDPKTLAADLVGAVVAVCPERVGWRDELETAGVVIDRVIDGAAARPRADHVGRLGLEALGAGGGQPIEALAARYLRRAEAEAVRLGGPVESGELARIAEGSD